MKKDNFWNRVFHSTEIEEEREKYDKCKRIVGFYPEIYERIQAAKNLLDLLDLHKKAWEKEFRNSNIGPCEYGMFRTNDISEMTAGEVYLGNIYGLWTFNIPEWEEHRDEPMSCNGFGINESILVYDLIVGQYRRILISNINFIKHEAQSYIDEYESINPVEDPFKLF